MQARMIWLGLALALGAGAGCKGTDEATAADYDDVAQALGGLTATGNGGGELGTIRDSAALAAGGTAPGLNLAGSGSFTGERLGLNYDYAIRCKDQGGAALERCGTSTDSASIEVSWSGTLATQILTGKVSREGHLELSGMQSDSILLNGASDTELDAHIESLFRNASRTYHLAYSADYTGITLSGNPGTITAGRIDYSLEAERKAQSGLRQSHANFEMQATLAFAPNGQATLTLDGEYQYSVDPTNGRVIKLSGIGTRD
jgi:hypothetical protein